MSFTCGKCGHHYFYTSAIQGGEHLDISFWIVVRCLKCDEKYLFHCDFGFKPFDVELVK